MEQRVTALRNGTGTTWPFKRAHMDTPAKTATALEHRTAAPRCKSVKLLQMIFHMCVT